MVSISLPSLATEDQLLEQANRGDQDAIMQIYENYFPALYQFIRLRVEETALAEDLTSEVFVKFIAALQGKNAPQQSLRGWLFQVARHELHHHYGKDKQFSLQTLEEWLPISTDSGVEAKFLVSENIDRVRKAIRMLSVEQQEVIILRFGQALSLEETADLMGKSIAAVKSLQFRAIESLRRALAQLRADAHVNP